MRKLIAGLGAVVATTWLGCATEVGPQSRGNAPPLSAQDQALVAEMEKNTLSEIELADGRLSFVEVAPGEVLISHEVPIGAQMPTVERAHELTLADLHRAYAPDVEVPQAIYDAMQRSRNASPGDAAEVETLAQDLEYGTHEGAPDLPITSQDEGPVSSLVQPLQSSIGWRWFQNNFCGAFHVEFEWCYRQAWQGAWARTKTHQMGAALCADKGAARLRVRRSGDTIYVRGVDYGWCVIHEYHGPHGVAGREKQRTVSYTVEWAADRVRFSGYASDDHAFFAPSGF